MQRVHLEPTIGPMALERVSTADIEALAADMRAAGLSPKTASQRSQLRALGV